MRIDLRSRDVVEVIREDIANYMRHNFGHFSWCKSCIGYHLEVDFVDTTSLLHNRSCESESRPFPAVLGLSLQGGRYGGLVKSGEFGSHAMSRSAILATVSSCQGWGKPFPKPFTPPAFGQ